MGRERRAIEYAADSLFMVGLAVAYFGTLLRVLREMGFLWALVAGAVFPLTFSTGPLFVGVMWNDWTPAIVGYGLPTLAGLIYLLIARRRPAKPSLENLSRYEELPGERDRN